MERHTIPPRDNWRAKVESQGLEFHTIQGSLYWDESAYYSFTAADVDEIQDATEELYTLCMEAVEHVIEDDLLDLFEIPAAFHDWVRESWRKREPELYGRFDLVYDGKRPPALLEFNADTPTALLEASVIQWFWFKDNEKQLTHPLETHDQFNSIHEILGDTWRTQKRHRQGTIYFVSVDPSRSTEDYMTVQYLRDTAHQAGWDTEYIAIQDIGWNASRQVFTDLKEQPIQNIFKLYPWEWLLREEFGQHLRSSNTSWLEPPWKMILSNKAILPILYEMYPDCPYLLRAAREPWGDTHVRKPIYGREGANVAIISGGKTLVQRSGEYGNEPVVYQELRPLPQFQGNYPVIGSWVVGGTTCGMGIREESSLITSNASRFVPHLFVED